MIDRFGEQELIELTDRDQLGVIDATVMAKALADADAEINAYLVARYTLPLAGTPPILTKFAADVARYQLYDTKATEQVKARYDDAVKFFKMLSSGAVSLGLDPASEPVAATGSVKFSAPTRVFNDDSLGGY